MGWFLTSDKKKAKKTKPSKRGGSADPKWDPKRTLLGVKFAGAAGAVFAVALGWHFGTQRLEAYVNLNHAMPLTADDVRFSEQPSLMSPAEINVLRAELAEAIGPQPLNRKGLENAAEILRGKPNVVRELRQVRRLPDGSVEVDLSFRRPAAIVRMRNERTGRASADGYHVIDDMGYQMYGPVYLADVAHLQLPIILDVGSNYRPKDNHGEFRWQGAEVDAALALIAELRDTPAMDFIDAISVGNRDEKERIRLVITTRVRPTAQSEPIPCNIVWGLPPGHERSIEPDADRKLAALKRVLADGRFRMGHWTEVWINTGEPRLPKAISE